MASMQTRTRSNGHGLASIKNKIKDIHDLYAVSAHTIGESPWINSETEDKMEEMCIGSVIPIPIKS